jgi:hypothetical protein
MRIKVLSYFIKSYWRAKMIKLIFKEPQLINLYLSERKYPHELRLSLNVSYNKGVLEINSESREYIDEFYVLNSTGYLRLENPTRNVSVEVAAELREFRIAGGKPLSLVINSKPLSRNEIHEIDRKLAPDDLKINWGINAYGFLGESYIKQHNMKLISIYIGTDSFHEISRSNFIKHIVEKADMLRREFIEVIVEPIDLSYVKEARLKGALELLLGKQKLLLGAMNKLKEAKTATDFRGIIDEVRRVVEGLERLKELCEEIYKNLYIESPDIEAKDKASKEMSEALLHSLKATYDYASRFGIHTKTLSGKLYTPIPTKAEAEFAVEQAMIELNYLVKLLEVYVLRT